jgi:hypothetical protein
MKYFLTILFNIALAGFLVFSSFWITGYYIIGWGKDARQYVPMSAKEFFYFGLATGLILVLDILIIRRFVRLILKRYRR